MKGFYVKILSLAFLFLFQVIITGKSDTTKVYTLDQIEIKSSRTILGNTDFSTEKDDLTNILGKNGFSLIRKGVFFAQDIYSDGFKKSDISVVIDGERYHSACPNRMDSPISRVNPLELSSVDLIKSAGSLQSGLGGLVSFKRSIPQNALKIKGGISGTTNSAKGIDAAIQIEKSEQRINIRYATGKPYEDSDIRNFIDNYEYKQNATYRLAEVSFQGLSKFWRYGANFTYSDNISFPYLKMDERLNRIFSSFLSYKTYKIYFNYTNHVMDNGLRKSNMYMKTSAKNLTIGAVGDFFEIYYRNWKADNYMNTPMQNIVNNFIPDVGLFSASVNRNFDFGEFLINSKAGLVNQSVGDKERLDFLKPLVNSPKSRRLFPIFGLSVSYSKAISNKIGIGVLAEAASEAPDPESLFITVQKPMGKPYWAGNPELNQPIRLTFRSSFNYEKIRLELYATNIWNYVNLQKQNVGTSKYQTYGNVDAYMLGLNLDASYKYLSINAVYTYAQNKTFDSPLAEIPPLKVVTKIVSPSYNNLSGFIRHTYNDSQSRVDYILNENSTPAWNKIDIGISYNFSNSIISFEAENVTNEKYYQHLSYMRDPFASGQRVFEPGRIFRFNIKFNNLM